MMMWYAKQYKSQTLDPMMNDILHFVVMIWGGGY